ncbi:ribonuclease H-like domain-containing protein [Tanacetum coccineum]
MRTSPGVDSHKFCMISITILESLSLMLKDLLDHLLVHRMSPLFLLKALAVLMIVPIDHEDLEQLDEFDLEEMDLKWQVAMISMRLKKFYKKTGRRLQFHAKEPVGFDKTKVECFNCHNTGHFARECRSKVNQESRRRDAGTLDFIYKKKKSKKTMEGGHGKQEEHKALVTLDGEGVDCIGHADDEQENFALMAYSNLGPDTEMSTRDKSGLGYGDQVHNGVLNYENEVFQSVFNSRSSDVEDSPVHDRFKNVEGMHAVPPPMTGNYMPPRPDREVDDSMFTYGPKQSKTSESDTQTSKLTLYESDSDDEYVIQPSKEQEKPSFAFVNTIKHVKTPRETIKEQNTYSPSPKADKRDWNGLISKREKNVLKYVELNKKKGKGTGQGENRPDNPQRALQNKGIVDSGCSRHMTGNKAYLAEYQDFNGGPVTFGGSKGYITGKGKIKIGKLDFEDVCFVKELHHFNLFSVSQMCDKKNKVLFTDSECLVLFLEFKLPDEHQVLLRIPRQNNMYSFNLENIVPSGGLACLIAKAIIDESNKWHRRLGHVNFKNLNKIMKGNLVRGLPSKIFQND